MQASHGAYDAIADPTRRRILELLSRGSMPAGAIAHRFRHISRPAVSKHLRILREARLVSTRRNGRNVRYSLQAAPLQDVSRWIQQYEVFWKAQLVSLRRHIEAGLAGGDRDE